MVRDHSSFTTEYKIHVDTATKNIKINAHRVKIGVISTREKYIKSLKNVLLFDLVILFLQISIKRIIITVLKNPVTKMLALCIIVIMKIWR